MDRERLKDAAAAFLAVIAPLLVFLHELDYGVLSIETALFVLAAALVATFAFCFISRDSDVLRACAFAGIILLFIDFQFELLEKWGVTLFIVCSVAVSFAWTTRKHLRVLLLVFFGAFNLATLAKFAASEVRSPVPAREGRTSEETLPLFVHLVLDEHIGIEGIPREIEGGTELADELTAFYVSNGFRVYGGAHSSYFATVDSFATFLNHDTRPPPDRLYETEEEGLSHVLNANLHFRKLVARGYRLRVYQTRYLDFCREDKGIESCHNYPHDRASRAELSRLGLPQRLQMIARMYGNFSYFVRELNQFYRFVRSQLGETGATLPEWSHWDGRVSAMAAMPVIDKIAEDIEKDSGGIAYFAHLLIPHYPYIYDRDCGIRSVSAWRNRYNDADESFGRRDELYFEQVQCTMERIRSLFDRMKAAGKFEKAIILVHGDHGSRIMSVDDLDFNRGAITEEDLRAGFSTLFAAKIPGHPPGYDSETRSISSLLRETVVGAIERGGFDHDHNLYLTNEDGDWSPHPFPTPE